MSRSPLLDSFDPFATHPFTNNSGLTPQPPLPSLYPLPIPSLHSQPTLSNLSSPTQTVNSMSSTPNMTTIQQPVPLPNSSQSTNISRSPPVFVPYRRDTSSPDLVLKQKHLSHPTPQRTK